MPFYLIVGLALAAYGVLVGGLYVFQSRLLYFPDRRRPELGVLTALGVQEVELQTADGLSLLSWYLPPRDARPVIAYFHGNGGHIGYRAGRLRQFGEYGYGALIVGYRGYGGNPGTPSEAGFAADADAAMDFLTERGIAPNRLVLYGESLGSGVAVALAAHDEVAALVLEAPFTSVAEVAQYHYSFVPAAALLRDRFDSLSRIGRARAPILVMHGGRDRVVPIRFGRALFDAAPEPKEFWAAAEAGHEGLARFGALEAVRNFLDRWVGQRTMASGGTVECPRL
jgi:fermentation-respiration switch protein FrsA (DUF1100 family)